MSDEKFQLTERFSFRCTKSDIKKLGQLAKNSGISRGEWVRRAILQEWFNEFVRTKNVCTKN